MNALADYTPDVPPATPWPCPDGEPFRWVDGILDCLHDGPVPALADSGVRVDLTPLGWAAAVAAAVGLVLLLVTLLTSKSSSSPATSNPAAPAPAVGPSTAGTLGASPARHTQGVPTVEGSSCRVCGCTDDEACWPFGCSWVEPDLCSACVTAGTGSSLGRWS